MSRTNRFVATLIVVGLACSVAGRLAGQPPVNDAPKVGTRITYTPQYRLKIMGAYYPGQGFRVASVEENGPATKLVRPGAPDTHGALEPGDVITRIDGQQVVSLQSFYDLLKAGAVAHGKVVISVQDVNTQQLIDWEATPVGGSGTGPEIPPAAQRVHVLLIALTGDKKIGTAQVVNLEGMNALVHEQIPAEKLASFRTLRDEEVTADKILDAVKNVQIGRGDTLFVYYGGHGAFDPQHAEGDPSGGHHFQIPSGALLRKTLMKQMLDKGARLTVLISDTCNVECRARLRAQDLATPLAPRAPQGPKPLEILLLQYRGVVDISASSRGQYSWNHPLIGGFFTRVAREVLRQQECSTWNVALERLSDQANGLYHEMRQKALDDPGANPPETLDSLRNQPDMLPQAFQLNVQRD